MILQALYEYYHRKADDSDSDIAPIGFEKKEIPFLIVIDENGKFIDLEDTREEKNKKLIGRKYIVPKGIGRTGKNAWQTANLLWDHYGYVLGYPKAESKKDTETAIKQLDSFITCIKQLPEKVLHDKGVKAVLQFYTKEQQQKPVSHKLWPECLKIQGCNLSFRLVGDSCIVPEKEVVKEFQNNTFSVEESGGKQAICLITGAKCIPQTLHTATPMPGSKTPTKLVGFQKNSGYDSYGKEQGENAPVSIEAESAYTTALNTLTKSDTNRVFLANTILVFWAEKKTEFEEDFPFFISDPPKDNPDRNVQAVKNLYTSMKAGRIAQDEKNRFYVLGLSPNSARISVRLWQTGTVKDFSLQIKKHFDDLEIIKGKSDRPFLTLTYLLCSCVLDYKRENIPPPLLESVIRSILTGMPYPQTLLQQCLRRIRAEQKVNHVRAAILKACINRHNRFYKNKEEITVALDKTNKHPAYRLGRLFAVLEKIQEEAMPGLNATIKDRFYGAASTNPITVFTQLLKLKNHHLAKIERPGRKIFFESLTGEIINELNGFPAHLSMEQQALFAIGYYHQRQHFFTKTENSEGETA